MIRLTYEMKLYSEKSLSLVRVRKKSNCDKSIGETLAISFAKLLEINLAHCPAATDRLTNGLYESDDETVLERVSETELEPVHLFIRTAILPILSPLSASTTTNLTTPIRSKFNLQ